MATLGEQLVAGLEARGIDTVFGIPGVHTVELYRGLAASSIRHVTPRHEQGAGFMADGYCRATGRVAAAFVITGPGLTNILTPMAQAHADSIPMLVVSSVNRTERRGMGGDLHEIANQGLIAAQVAAFSHTLTHPDQLGEVLARAWAVFDSGRPRPVHIEVPVDLLGSPGAPAVAGGGSGPLPPVGHPRAISAAARHLKQAKAPLLLLGGGTRWRDGSEAMRRLAETLSAPVVTTANARGVMPVDHPLSVPASPSLAAVRTLVQGSDCVLAIGTEIGQTDYDVDDQGAVEFPGTLLRIDIDTEQIGRGPRADVAIIGDAATSARLLDDALASMAPVETPGKLAKSPDGAARAAVARNVALEEVGARYRKIINFLDLIRDVLPETPIVCDSTQAAYAGNFYYAAPAPGRWFTAATGYGALGYGLPAAVGAAQGLGAPVVCIAGDGGLQFSLAELGTAVEECLPVVLLVWNNQGYGEIKDYMLKRGISPVGVDLHTPDFVAIGKAYGAHAERLDKLGDLAGLLRAAARRDGPTVIEIDEGLVLAK